MGEHLKSREKNGKQLIDPVIHGAQCSDSAWRGGTREQPREEAPSLSLGFCPFCSEAQRQAPLKCVQARSPCPCLLLPWHLHRPRGSYLILQDSRTNVCMPRGPLCHHGFHVHWPISTMPPIFQELRKCLNGGMKASLLYFDVSVNQNINLPLCHTAFFCTVFIGITNCESEGFLIFILLSSYQRHH